MRSKSLKTPVLIAIFLFLACLALAAASLRVDRHPPALSIELAPSLNRHSQIKVLIQLQHELDEPELEVFVSQGQDRYQVTPVKIRQGKRVEAAFALADTPLTDGEIQIRTRARSDGYKRILGGLLSASWTEASASAQADLTAPEAEFKIYPERPVSGGSALLLVQASEELSEISMRGPGLPLLMVPLGDLKYAALLPLPIEEESLGLFFHLADLAGNSLDSELALEVEDFEFEDDVIRLDERFFRSKFEEFMEISGMEGSPLQLFLFMNREERAASYLRLQQLCSGGSREKLWAGAFLAIPGAVQRSNFADRREYVYRNEVIDRQRHLGLDFASVARDSIPAANHGRVAFTGSLGIHGQAVLLDHGMGLFSLYSHLSSINCQAGDMVARGQIIGRTGTTGMAGGDHLHFEILINGRSVNPTPWFDPKWVAENIEQPLENFTGYTGDNYE